MKMKSWLLSGLAWGGLAQAQTATQDEAANAVFHLGEVTVTAARREASKGSVTVTQEQMRIFHRTTLDQALNLVPGATISDVGARNETDIWLRGFDRWRVPLYQDGIPVYLPVDNRIDFGRFTTADIAEVQINKGFASVIDGPGAMGGDINIVSREVSKPLEAEIGGGINLDNAGGLAGGNLDAFAGTRHDLWFAQAAVTFDHTAHYRLSDNFKPGTFQASGNRVESKSQDYKINLKAGFTPNSTDEYAINLIDQVGNKGNPPPDSMIPAASLSSVKYWTWPAWDKQSAYFLSKTETDNAGSFVKTRVYYDRFYNVLDSYDSIGYNTQTTPKAFDSYYDDRAAGASGEYDWLTLGGANNLRLASFLRLDEHNEYEDGRNGKGYPWYQQPWEPARELTYSEAIEDVFKPSSAWTLTGGFSYDARHLMNDSEWVESGSKPPYGYSYKYPVSNKSGLNGEAEATYHYSSTGSITASFADRLRFPTLFEMYSTRFGTYVNNPALQPERSYYSQFGANDQVLGFDVGVNVYYARVLHAINAVALTSTISEDENTGTERHTGYEIDLSRQLGPDLKLGANYAYLDRQNLSGANVATDTPRNKAFFYAQINVMPQLSIVPTVEVESNRVLQNAVNSLKYYYGGAYTLTGIKAHYQVTPKTEVEAGVTNLLDTNYLLEDGYNAPGRGYFVNVRQSY